MTEIDIATPAKIHIMGVCGTAMSSLAGLLKKRGHIVCGSDRNFYPPISEHLKHMGIKTFKGYKKEHIHSGLDLVIVGNVISKNIPEAKALLSSRVPYITLPEALNTFITEDKNVIMVCGTHGKTTVSCLAAWVLNECGLYPGFMIGGISDNFKTNFRLTDSKWFVIEGDEYDTSFFEKSPKFLHYKATHTLLNNIEFDHADIYKNLGEVEQVFQSLLKKPFSGLIAGIDSPLVHKHIKKSHQKIITYGLDKGDWLIFHREVLGESGQTLWIKEKNNKAIKQETIKIDTSLQGEHNALNVLAVWVLSRVLNLDRKKTLKAFKSFLGVQRRFQVLVNTHGITLIEDFAHHPTAVSYVLRSVREIYPKRRILAVFEPRSNTSRKNIFQKDYQKALSLADVVFCVEAYNSSTIEKPDRFSSEDLVHDLSQKKKTAFYAKTPLDLANILKDKINRGDVIIVMSNGDFGDIYSIIKKDILHRQS